MEETRDYYHVQAAYWDTIAEDTAKAHEYALQQRKYYLQCLGMIAVDGGFPE